MLFSTTVLLDLCRIPILHLIAAQPLQDCAGRVEANACLAVPRAACVQMGIMCIVDYSSGRVERLAVRVEMNRKTSFFICNILAYFSFTFEEMQIKMV